MKKKVTLVLNQAEANTLLLAIEAAMSEQSRAADTEKSVTRLASLDRLWSRVMDAGLEAGFGDNSGQKENCHLDLVQCSEV